ncbi:MAG: site-specific integrase [Oscillospiraceae bacterium]|jgi:integrase|nr:site-specific integrase [Oscillospiraceae bacterium]
MPKSPRRKDGYFEKSLTDARTGKRVHFYAKSERELTRKIMEYTGKQERGRTFSEVAAEWRNTHYENLAYTTQRGYEASYNRALDEFGDVPVKNITTLDIKAHLSRMAAQKQSPTTLKPMQYSAKTLKAQQLIYSLILGYAAEQGDISVNPANALKMPRAQKATVKRQPAGEEDEAIIKASADIWLLPFFLLYTGLRKGEALAIQQKDIDREHGIIHITKSLYHEVNNPHIKTPKTIAGVRTVPILAPLLPKLPEGDPDDYLFHSLNPTKPLTKSEFQRAWERFTRKTGITCTAHQLRHSFATLLFDAGIDVKDAQDILGHSTEAMTRDVYTHIREMRRRDTANKLNEYLSNIR